MSEFIKKTSKGQYLIIASFIISIILVVVINWNNAIHIDDFIKFNENWTYKSTNTNKTGIISLPIRIDKVPINDTIIIENIIPNYYFKQPQLIISSNLQRVKVYLDDKIIYELKNTDKNRVEPMTQWIIAELPKEFQGKKISIEYTSSYLGINGQIGEIYIGEKETTTSGLVNRYGSEIVVATILLSLGVLSISIYLCIMKKKNHILVFFI